MLVSNVLRNAGSDLRGVPYVDAMAIHTFLLNLRVHLGVCSFKLVLLT